MLPELTPEEKRRAKGRKVALRRSQENTVRPKKEPKEKRISKRSPLYGQPVTLKLPSLVNRVRGRTSPPTISRHVIDAIRRRDVEQMAEKAVGLAQRLALGEGVVDASEMTKEKKDG